MDGYVTIGTSLDTKGFDAQIKDVEHKLDMLEKEYSNVKRNDPFDKDNLRQYELEIEKTKNKLIALRKQQEKIYAMNSANTDTGSSLPSLKNVTQMIEKNTSNTVKQVGRWAMAVFSVRTAYQLVQRASATLQQYDSQYATDIQYLYYLLAQAVAPILKEIVSLAYTLMSYISYIANAWFGVNLFANASAKNFSKMASSTSQMKKDLQGFDEMNVLSDNSSNGASGTGTAMPSFDMSKLQGDIPSWIKWIADHGSEIMSFVTGLVTALGLVKLGLDNIKAVGIGIVLGGTIELVKDLIDYLKDPTYEKFGEIISDIGVIVLGFGLICGSVATGIIGVVILLVGLIITHWDEIKVYLAKFWDWFKVKLDAFGDWCGVVGEKIQSAFGKVKDFLISAFEFMFGRIRNTISSSVQVFITVFSGIKTGFKQIFDGILLIFKVDFAKGFESIGKGIANTFISILNGAISRINSFLPKVANTFNPILSKLNLGLSIPKSIPKVSYLKTGGIINKPGQGIAIGGESGAEGVIPLTDAQAMETLGQAIGRYITVNANVVNKMNGRVLSRELIKVQNQSDFAFNL